MTLAETSNCIAVFKGNLLNKAELALQVTCPPPHITEAQMLLHLYEAMGIDMLSRLNGQYAFCLYDTKQVGSVQQHGQQVHWCDPGSSICSAMLSVIEVILELCSSAL